jgi:hypothetical protein
MEWTLQSGDAVQDDYATATIFRALQEAGDLRTAWRAAFRSALRSIATGAADGAPPAHQAAAILARHCTLLLSTSRALRRQAGIDLAESRATITQAGAVADDSRDVRLRPGRQPDSRPGE